ncbi:MAG: MBL fold metallo-hydrolase [Planctomycetes bacterium]|nr:MBL fold metallo-hydrolase [Planctomycetota bacterium]
MTLLQRSLVPALLVLFGLGLAFGRQSKQPVVRAEKVAGTVSVLFGEGGNIGVSSGADGILIVDDQFERLVPEIEAALAKLAPGKAAPRFLVNTHHHGDHTGGNAHFGKSAVVLAHENVRARLLDEKAPATALPVVTYADGIALHLNGEEIRVLHVPGAHTDGDSVVWFKGSNVVHLGDLYFQLGYPFVDVASGGNVLGLIEGLRGLLPGLPADVRLVPGHGVVTGREGLEEYVKMLETLTARVREHLAEGRDVKAMLAAGVTKDFDPRWGNFAFVPPEKFVASIVDSLR